MVVKNYPLIFLPWTEHHPLWIRYYIGSYNTMWTDLQLAAELGKVLLERNKELEAHLQESQQSCGDHTQQIALLTKQVEILRHANDSRMRIYEEVDRSAQEMDRSNQDLRQTLRAERAKVKNLNQTVEALESRCDELQAKVEQLKRDMRALNKDRGNDRSNRTWSVPSLNDAEYGFGYRTKDTTDYLGFAALGNPNNSKRVESQRKEIKELKDTVRVLKLQYSVEQKMRFDLERNVDNLKQDNCSLIGKLKELEGEFEKQRELYRQATKLSRRSEEHSPLCAKYPSRAASVTGSDIGDGEFLEHDIDELPRRKQVVRLRCGGSAYGSRESLNQIGLEAVTPTLESCSDILVDAVQRNPSTADTPPEETPTVETAPDPDNTLLGELEEQYRKLVKKYESLIDAKKTRTKTRDMATQDVQPRGSSEPSEPTEESPVKLRRPKALGISREVQTAWRKSSCGLDFTSPVNRIDNSFHKGPPEYKRLFKEIFETLKRSAEFDGELSPTESK